ncbi:MAG: carbohydrate ABC transporter permease [Bulleidia sp.]
MTESIKIAVKALKGIFLGISAIAAGFPFVWMVLSALKTKEEIMSTSQLLPSVPQWQNFISVLTESPIPKYMFSSMWVALLIVALQIISGAMLAYAMVFMKFKGRNALFALVMATYMLPPAATYIPGYIILSRMHLLSTFTGIIISSTISLFGIFLLRQNFMQIPKGLVEAARMDGANHWRILWEQVCPMTKSSFVTFGLMSFISAYSNYMWPSLITNDPDHYLISQGLRSFFIEGGAYGTNWSLVMAASAVVIIPLLILFAFTQKWFINGIGGETGIKG